MKIGLFEIILIISVFQLVIFTFFLLTKRPFKTSNLILSIFLLAQALVISNNLFYTEFFFKYYIHLFYYGMPFCLIWGPSFYFYVKSLAFSDFKLKPIYLLHLIPFFSELIYLVVSFYFRDAETKRSLLVLPSAFNFFHSNILSFFVMLQILVYNLISLQILYNYHKKLKDNFSTISKINFSWLSLVIVGYTIAHIFSTTIQLITFSEGYNLYLRITLFSIFLIFFNIIFFKGWQRPEIFSYTEENIKYKSSRLTKHDAEEWLKRINEFMKTNKPFLNSGLSINQLAEELGISPKILSQIINEQFNQNFFDYINTLRIEESKKMLLDSSNKRTVLEILYDAGFNSKTAFNLAFKKNTGLTPTEFRKRNKQDYIPVSWS